MMKTAIGIFVLAIAVALSACADRFDRHGRYDRHERYERDRPAGPPPAPRGRATEMQIERSIARYSALLRAMDADGIASMYAPDGVMERQSGGPLRGREEIRAFLASAGPNVRVLSNEMRTISLAYDGPAVIHRGEFRQSTRVNGKVTNVSGRFEATWERGRRGQWFITRMATRPNK
jgi:uncharacterized protein (TIGR02246 family)